MDEEQQEQQEQEPEQPEQPLLSALLARRRKLVSELEQIDRLIADHPDTADIAAIVKAIPPEVGGKRLHVVYAFASKETGERLSDTLGLIGFERLPSLDQAGALKVSERLARRLLPLKPEDVKLLRQDGFCITESCY